MARPPIPAAERRVHRTYSLAPDVPALLEALAAALDKPACRVVEALVRAEVERVAGRRAK